MILSRRGILTGLASLIAAPAIVRAENLMPVRGIIMPFKPILTSHGIVSIKTAGSGWIEITELSPILSPSGRPVYVTRVVPTVTRFPDGYPPGWSIEHGQPEAS